MLNKNVSVYNITLCNHRCYKSVLLLSTLGGVRNVKHLLDRWHQFAYKLNTPRKHYTDCGHFKTLLYIWKHFSFKNAFMKLSTYSIS